MRIRLETVACFIPRVKIVEIARAVRGGMDARLLHLFDLPEHRKVLLALAFQYDLQRAAQADRVSEEDAFLDIEFGAVG